MANEFFGRQQELQELNRLWGSFKAEFLILYGRRRVGKTALLAEWIRRTGNRALYWVASSTSVVAQLRSFSQSVYNFENPGTLAPDNFTYASWEQAFREIARLAKDHQLALFIDEFTYLLEVDPSITGLLQNLWDHVLKNANLFLGLSGSHLGMMKREFLSYQAPLYGRASSQIILQSTGLLCIPFLEGYPPLGTGGFVEINFLEHQAASADIKQPASIRTQAAATGFHFRST